MKIKVNMLNVQDGDAIIVELEKQGQKMVMVIDSGKAGYYLSKMKPKLQQVLESCGKSAPDIVVCTHYDSDHIGGLIPLIQDYGEGVKEVWVHQTPEAMKGFMEQAQLLLEDKSTEEHGFLKKLDIVPQESKMALLNEKAAVIIESITELKRFLSLIPGEKVRHVFHGDSPVFANWPEVRVIGPTKSYFDELFPPTKSLREFVLEEIREEAPKSEMVARFQKNAGMTDCEKLKDDTSASITATNKASIIILIKGAKGNYIFTGDAGLQSFKMIPNWKTELADIYFLKVPHHGSNNNMSAEMSELMKPVYAYSSGYKHQDEEVLGCLASKTRNLQTVSTKDSGDLYFDK